MWSDIIGAIQEIVMGGARCTHRRQRERDREKERRNAFRDYL
jgi:hypothetical protein